MSEKKRQKKDGERKEKKTQQMRESVSERKAGDVPSRGRAQSGSGDTDRTSPENAGRGRR